MKPLTLVRMITVINVLYLIFINPIFGLPSRNYRDGGENTDGSVTTRVLDLTNPEHEGLLRQFNISADQLKALRTSTTAASNSHAVPEEDRLADIKEMRFQDIKNKIENAINGNTMNYDNLPIHEMAAYPTCAQINETAWQQENNITIRFAASLFENTHPDMYLDTAVLRLFKLNPLPETTPRSYSCDDVTIEPQIRVTISTIQHLKRNKRVSNPFNYSSAERKKRICNTLMLNMSQTGWIEIDVKKAINLWEKAERQSRNANFNSNSNNSQNNNRMPIMVGWLTIEVHDEEEKPLKAGLYFEPPKCSEAFPAIPWNFYSQYAAWPATDMEKVPRSPRLDIKLIDYRSTVPNRHTATHNTQHNHNHRTFYHHMNGPSSGPITTEQSTTESNNERTETRTHRRRHEQSNHHSRHHQHHHHQAPQQKQEREQQDQPDQPDQHQLHEQQQHQSEDQQPQQQQITTEKSSRK